MNNDLVYKIAFTFLKRITPALIRDMETKGVTPQDFFSMPVKDLVIKLGISQDHSFDTLAREEALSHAKKEWEEIERHHITPLFLLDDNYPQRLAEIEDAPVILYKLGEADLDNENIASIVGTRRPTAYGIGFCNQLIKDLSVYFNNILIVSGLAYGIDSIAHKKALECNLPTVAVVAHGLNMIYPANHRNLAKEIVRQGGAIISEYPFGVKPFRANFLARNRIVAALSDVTMVIESAIKGGAMSTANLAFSYSRDLMALPGRINDELSQGCNLLLRKQKAAMLTSAADVIETTGWQPLDLNISPQQRNLFPELEGEAKTIYENLRFNTEPLQMDRLAHLTGIPIARLSAVVSELEFDGIIIRHPGNRFSVS